MALPSRGGVHIVGLDVVVPRRLLLLLTCQGIRGECQPSINTMSHKIMYVLSTVVSAR